LISNKVYFWQPEPIEPNIDDYFTHLGPGQHFTQVLIQSWSVRYHPTFRLRES